jgi:hypothetical protein
VTAPFLFVACVAAFYPHCRGFRGAELATEHFGSHRGLTEMALQRLPIGATRSCRRMRVVQGLPRNFNVMKQHCCFDWLTSYRDSMAGTFDFKNRRGPPHRGTADRPSHPKAGRKRVSLCRAVLPSFSVANGSRLFALCSTKMPVVIGGRKSIHFQKGTTAPRATAVGKGGAVGPELELSILRTKIFRNPSWVKTP